MFTMFVLSCITTALSMPQKPLQNPRISPELPNHWALASPSENCQSKGNGNRLGWYKTDRLFEFVTLDKEFRIAVWFCLLGKEIWLTRKRNIQTNLPQQTNITFEYALLLDCNKKAL